MLRRASRLTEILSDARIQIIITTPMIIFFQIYNLENNEIGGKRKGGEDNT